MQLTFIYYATLLKYLCRISFKFLLDIITGWYLSQVNIKIKNFLYVMSDFMQKRMEVRLFEADVDG